MKKEHRMRLRIIQLEDAMKKIQRLAGEKLWGEIAEVANEALDKTGNSK